MLIIYVVADKQSLCLLYPLPWFSLACSHLLAPELLFFYKIFYVTEFCVSSILFLQPSVTDSTKKLSIGFFKIERLVSLIALQDTLKNKCLWLLENLMHYWNNMKTELEIFHIYS